MTVMVHRLVLPQERCGYCQCPHGVDASDRRGGAINASRRAGGMEIEIIAAMWRVPGRPQPGHRSLVKMR